MPHHDDLDLLQAYLDGALDAREAAALEVRLKAEPELAEMLVRLAREDAVLVDWARSHRSAAQIQEQLPNTVPLRRWDVARVLPAAVLVAAAAVIVIALVTYFTPPPAPAPMGPAPTAVAVLHEAYGQVELVNEDGEATPIAAGQELLPGQSVRTGGVEGFAVVRYPDSTQLELSTGTLLRLLETGDHKAGSGKRVFLQEGYVTADVHRQPEEQPMVVLTPSAEIRVLGTRFRSLSTRGETRVELEEGRVQMIRRTDGKAIEVPKGFFAVATEKAPEPFTPRPLPTEITRPPLTFSDSAGPVATLAYSPDGRTLATGGWNGEVKVWDPATGVLLQTLKGHSRRVYCITYAADGQTLYSAAADRSVRAWDVAKGAEKYAIKKLPREVISLAVSVDGKLIALTGALYREKKEKRVPGSQGRVAPLVLLCDAETGVEQRSFPAPGDDILAMAFSPEGLLALGYRDGTVTLWDPYAGRAERTLEGLGGKVLSLAFSHDGRWLAAGNEDSTLRVWDLSGKLPDRTFVGRTREVRSVAFSPDGNYLAAGGNAGLVDIWDVEAGREQLGFRAHKHAVGGVAFAPDGRSIASSGWDRTVKIWTLVVD